MAGGDKENGDPIAGILRGSAIRYDLSLLLSRLVLCNWNQPLWKAESKMSLARETRRRPHLPAQQL